MRLSKPGLPRANAVTACLTAPTISLCLEVPSKMFTETPLHMSSDVMARLGLEAVALAWLSRAQA